MPFEGLLGLNTTGLLGGTGRSRLGSGGGVAGTGITERDAKLGGAGGAVAGGGGISGKLSGLLGGISVGSSLGGALSGFNEERQLLREFDRENRAGFQTSLGVLQRLFGQGFNVGGKQRLLTRTGPEGSRVRPEITLDPEFQKLHGIREDQVVQPGSVEARSVPIGTVIARRPGDPGLDPRILEARQQLQGLISTEAVSSEDRARLREIGSGQLGNQLQAGTQPTGRGLSASLAQLDDISAAGVDSAQTELAVSVSNRQFAGAAREAGFGFIERLFSVGRSTF